MWSRKFPKDVRIDIGQGYVSEGVVWLSGKRRIIENLHLLVGSTDLEVFDQSCRREEGDYRSSSGSLGHQNSKRSLWARESTGALDLAGASPKTRTYQTKSKGVADNTMWSVAGASSVNTPTLPRTFAQAGRPDSDRITGLCLEKSWSVW
jgi:hypothetical protein